MNGIRLTGKQRDFLASYPDDVVVQVIENDDEEQVRIYADDSGLDESHREMWVPVQGFIGQPHIELHDPEALLDRIPTALWTPEQIDEVRDERLESLPPVTQSAFFHLMFVAQHEHQDHIDWDKVLDCIAAKSDEQAQGESEGEERPSWLQ